MRLNSGEMVKIMHHFGVVEVSFGPGFVDLDEVKYPEVVAFVQLIRDYQNGLIHENGGGI